MGCGDEHHETDQTNQRIEDDKSREKNKRGTSGQIIYLSFDRLSDLFLHLLYYYFINTHIYAYTNYKIFFRPFL